MQDEKRKRRRDLNFDEDRHQELWNKAVAQAALDVLIPSTGMRRLKARDAWQQKKKREEAANALADNLVSLRKKLRVARDGFHEEDVDEDIWTTMEEVVELADNCWTHFTSLFPQNVPEVSEGHHRSMHTQTHTRSARQRILYHIKGCAVPHGSVAVSW